VPFHSGAILHPKIIKQILAIIAEAAERHSEESIHTARSLVTPVRAFVIAATSVMPAVYVIIRAQPIRCPICLEVFGYHIRGMGGIH
jgi:hypothetical protein